MSRDQRVVLGCLAGLGVSLLLVGVVSGTFIRHVIQALPIVVAALVAFWRPIWGAYSAMPLFVFWTLIAALIWMYLLGISKIISGQFTAPEIALTVSIVLCSIVGVLACVRLGRSLKLLGRSAVFLLFGVLQLVAMWVSFMPAFATR